VEDLVIRDERRQLELRFKRNKDGEVMGIEIYFDRPRQLVEFVNYSAFWSPPPAAASGPPPPQMPRPCGGKTGG